MNRPNFSMYQEVYATKQNGAVWVGRVVSIYSDHSGLSIPELFWDNEFAYEVHWIFQLDGEPTAAPSNIVPESVLGLHKEPT